MAFCRLGMKPAVTMYGVDGTATPATMESSVATLLVAKRDSPPPGISVRTPLEPIWYTVQLAARGGFTTGKASARRRPS